MFAFDLMYFYGFNIDIDEPYIYTIYECFVYVTGKV